MLLATYSQQTVQNCLSDRQRRTVGNRKDTSSSHYKERRKKWFSSSFFTNAFTMRTHHTFKVAVKGFHNVVDEFNDAQLILKEEVK